MKKFILLLSILIPTSSLCQNKNFELGFYIGNNGQVEKTLSDFYIWNHETYYLDDSYENKTFYLKYNLMGMYKLNDIIALKLKLGYSKRKDYFINNQTPIKYITYKFDQRVSNINPAICFIKIIDDLEISTGIEFPFMFVSSFEFNSTYNNIPDSINISEEIKGTLEMDGGFIWGLNNFISLKYFFNDRISIGTEINYGLLIANLGDKVERKTEYVIPPKASDSVEFDKNYKKTYFSTPEFSFGLTVKI